MQSMWNRLWHIQGVPREKKDIFVFVQAPKLHCYTNLGMYDISKWQHTVPGGLGKANHYSAFFIR